MSRATFPKLQERLGIGCLLLIAAPTLVAFGGAWLLAEGPHGPGGSVKASEYFPFGFPLILLGLIAFCTGAGFCFFAVGQWFAQKDKRTK